jgi:hypothetical protein
LGGSYRARTRSGHTRTRKHRRLEANGGPGWSLGVNNGRRITNHSTPRLCHGKCPAPCGRSPFGYTGTADPRVLADGCSGLRQSDRRAARMDRLLLVSSLRRSAFSPTGFRGCFGCTSAQIGEGVDQGIY